ncbi:MAG: hypothetical protein MJA31_20785 [Clostridia bacterium]|nr:hypothetical protein [Clostridia bacterium]
MNGNLVILIHEQNIDLIFGYANIPVATARKSYYRIQEIETFLSQFIHSNHLQSESIKNIIVAADLTMHFKNLKKCSFGYIQMGDLQNIKSQPKSYKNAVLDIYNLNISVDDSTSQNVQLEEYLHLLNDKGIDKIALNSSFSTFNSQREKELIISIQEAYPNTFTILPSSGYNSFNYILRENNMLLDMLLYDSTGSFINEIKKAFNHLKINAPIYFVKGDGTLTGLNITLASPMVTWQSFFALQLISAGIVTGEKDAFILTQHNHGKKIGIIQNGLPKLSDTFSNYQGFHIPNSFPQSTYYDALTQDKALYHFLKYNNTFEGPVPIISYLKSFGSHSLFPYPIKEVKNHATVMAEGAFNSFFQLELTSIVNSSKPGLIEKEKERLILKSSDILKKDHIFLKSVAYSYELNQIKYRLENAFYVKLIVKGKIN